MTDGTPPEGQGQQTQDPTTAAPAVPPAPTPVGDGPWAADINLLFQDPATRATVDSFIRTKVQPHTTKLEQELKSSEQARNLWQALEQNPIDTYVQMTHEMFGEEAASQLLQQLQQQQQQADQQPQVQQQQQQLDPRMAEALAYIEEKRNAEIYDQEMQRIAAEHPEVDVSFLDPFVAAAGGDFDRAVSLYADFMSRAQPTPPAPPREQAPPTLGSDTESAQPPSAPVAPRKQTISEAIDDFMNEQRAAREAPPVL